MPNPSKGDATPQDRRDAILDDSERLLRLFLNQQTEAKDDPAKRALSGFREVDEQLDNLLDRIDEDLFSERGREGDKDHEGEDWILGDFRLLNKIGSGGMGTVYEAEQLSLNRKVALKILPTHLRFSGEAIKKFHREAEAGGRQSHPGIVSVYAVGQDRGVPYLAQELVAGGRTLADYLKFFSTQDPLPQGYFREAARLVVQAADALHHAHMRGVIHRDVKPSNLLIDERGQIKVTDFGLAKMEDALTQSRTGTFAGTPYYMAPEMTSTSKVEPDPKMDIYSLGVTLYELLTFNRPFEGTSSHEILKKIVSQEPKDPRTLNARVPRDLAVICLKALEKKPEARYADMPAFADDLKRFLSGDVIRARPATFVQTVSKWVRRNPALSAAMAVAALALMVLIAYIPWTMARLTDKRDKARDAEMEATKQAEISAEQYEEIVRLTDAKFLSQLIDRFHLIWPAFPENVPEIRQWLQAAQKLIGRVESHRSLLNTLHQRLEAEGASLEDRSWEYEERTQIWHANMLEDLIDQVDDFSNKETGLYYWMKERLAFASSVYQRTITDQSDNWQSTITAIADRSANPIYDGLQIEPQLGLIPLGRDPQSGLFEFAHLQSGNVPKRDISGKILFEGDSGLVLVLLPGGTYQMGSRPPSKEHPLGTPHVDPLSEPAERPLHSVTLKPFFISKYEMTQEQWKRFTRNNPSEFSAWYSDGVIVRSLVKHPVEYVTIVEYKELLPKLALRLPTEAEWEYAARGGTTTIYCTGDEKETLIGTVNISDKFSYDYDKVSEAVHFDLWLDDGFSKHAPVDLFKPNPFGLHSILGNVSEVCDDRLNYNYEGAPADGSSWDTGISKTYVFRGGNFRSKAIYCRCARRNKLMREDRGSDIGVRPAMSLRTGGVASFPISGAAKDRTGVTEQGVTTITESICSESRSDDSGNKDLGTNDL